MRAISSSRESIGDAGGLVKGYGCRIEAVEGKGWIRRVFEDSRGFMLKDGTKTGLERGAKNGA
jgi:hypothetical protein